jgi:hypothetical protein
VNPIAAELDWCARPGGCPTPTACRVECSWSAYTPAPRNWIYYRVKPYLPRRVRTILLRLQALHVVQRSSEPWPIDPRAGRVPDDWPGWPDGKRFAVLLTHDVERTVGMQRCLQLAALEERLGFRSSFNFVPEGEYRVGRELREELIAGGFEVGVHDLHHDGRLYESARAFPEKARRINNYLQEWGAAGFRSGFMLRNLDWIQDLKIIYDASTFDTDPFQPQRGGAGTIFPFYVNGTQGRRGFVELPYTLAQDSSLFLVLEQQTIDFWKRKTDWIVAHGGMVLLNVHPDYLWFDESEAPQGTFPAKHYVDFLAYLRDRYAGTYWSPLPRELAIWYAISRRNGDLRARAVEHLPPRISND